MVDIHRHFVSGGGHANPNVVIVHGGTNDIFLNKTVSDTLGWLDDLLQDIHKTTPGAIIILSTIGPWCPNTQYYANVPPYNTGIKNLVTKYQGQGWKIILADVYNELTVSADLVCQNGDVVHPNPS